MWYVFLALSFAAAAAAAGWAIYISAAKRAGRFMTPLRVLFGGAFLAVLFLMIPIFVETVGTSGWFKAFLLSMHGAMQAFTIDSDRTIILEMIPADIVGIYSVWLSFLFVAAPVLTFGVVLSFFRDFTAHLSYLLHFKRPVYAFTTLDERSAALGRDVKKHRPDALLVYAGVSEEDEREDNELILKARRLGALLFRKKLVASDLDESGKKHKKAAAGLGAHSKKAEITVFAMSGDEAKNVEDGLKLAESFGARPGSSLYVFSTRPEAELLFSHASTECLKIRRVNEARSLVCRELYEKGVRLFRTAKPAEDGKKAIHAVIVGLGAYGTEELKALSWYCQMEGYRVIIDAFDKDPLAKERFTAACPELMSPKLNGKRVPGESDLEIRIHSDVDAAGAAFAGKIEELKTAAYVFVALGSDEENIRTAADLRMRFKRMGIAPMIDAVVMSSASRKALTGATNFKNQPYDLGFIGDIESACSWDTILHSTLEDEALDSHKQWGEEDDFWRYEYNRSSSIAAAMHAAAAAECLFPDEDLETKEFTEEEYELIERSEHSRWNAYMRSEGYVFSGVYDPSTRDDLAKKHHCLVPYEKLNDKDRRKDRNVVELMKKARKKT